MEQTSEKAGATGELEASRGKLAKPPGWNRRQLGAAAGVRRLQGIGEGVAV
jgi:hypothetical protein